MSREITGLLESVKSMHVQEVNPVERKIVIPPPQGFLFNDCENRSLHNRMGNFYEFVSTGLYGGERGNWHYVPGEDEELRLVKPDIVDRKRKNVREIKANKFYQELNLLDAQMGRYLSYLDKHPQLVPIFEIYRHGFESIKSFRGSEKELFESLSSNTQYALRLPLSLVLGLWQLPPRNGNRTYVRRYESREGTPDEKLRGTINIYPSCTCVKNKTLQDLLTKPEEIISLVGKNSRGYTISRLQSPSEFSVNGVNVKTFPILDIREEFP